MRILRGVLAAAITAAVAVAQRHAVTRVPSADGQFWDIQDTSPWSLEIAAAYERATKHRRPPPTVR